MDKEDKEDKEEYEKYERFNSQQVIYHKSGSYALVYKIQKDGQIHVVKKTSKTLTDKSKQKYIQKYREIMLHNKNKQSNLVQIEHIWKNQGYNFIMMKYYKYTLEKYLQIKWKDIQDNPKLGMSIFIQILKGLVELKISHRDIKPSNILINQLQNGKLKVVLSDFGQCNNGQYLNSSNVGTQSFMAPQIRFRTQSFYTRKTDIWSLGVVLYLIFCGCTQKSKLQRYPYKLNDQLQLQPIEKLIQTMSKQQLWFHQKTPDTIKKLVHRMLKIEPSQRLSLFQLLRFINKNITQLGYDEEQLIQECQKLKQMIETEYQTYKKQQNFLSLIKATKQSYQCLYVPFQKNIRKIENKQITIYRKTFFMYYLGFQLILKQLQELYRKNNDRKLEVDKYIFGNQQKQTKKKFLRNFFNVIKLKAQSFGTQQQIKDLFIKQNCLKNKQTLSKLTINLKELINKDEEIIRNIIDQFNKIVQRNNKI